MTRFNRISRASLVAGICLTFVSACGGDSNSTTPPIDTPTPDPVPTDPEEPTFSAELFNQNSTEITNNYFPLTPGVSMTYEGTNEDGETERVVISVSHETRVVDGVGSAIVIDRVYVNGELEEETFDWFAQDMEGNVWYMGEDSAEVEDGEIINHEGSWESGKDIEGIGSNAIAGIQMKASLEEGDSYQQEYYEGVAEDMAQIDSLNAEVALADGTTYDAIKILEWDPLESDAVNEYKFYALDIGLVKEEKIDQSESIELISTTDQTNPNIDSANFNESTIINHPRFPMPVGQVMLYEAETEDGTEEIRIEVLPETKMVMGIENRVIRDTVTLDGVVTEDTFDWFAQDNDGNVWYFGEDVDNYNYDEEGNLIDIDHEGAWEAGVEGAQPGIQMPAMPRIGDSYRQEYWQGEAEDLAVVKDLDTEVTLQNGTTYSTWKIQEWNPLEEDSLEFKYYAEGVGLVKEEDAEGEEVVELIDMFP